MTRGVNRFQPQHVDFGGERRKVGQQVQLVCKTSRFLAERAFLQKFGRRRIRSCRTEVEAVFECKCRSIYPVSLRSCMTHGGLQ